MAGHALGILALLDQQKLNPLTDEDRRKLDEEDLAREQEHKRNRAKWEAMREKERIAATERDKFNAAVEQRKKNREAAKWWRDMGYLTLSKDGKTHYARCSSCGKQYEVDEPHLFDERANVCMGSDRCVL